MVLHTVVLAFKEGTSPDLVSEIDEAFAALATSLRGVVSFNFGPDAGLKSGNGDYAITAVFEDEAAYGEYAADPEHRRIGDELLRPNAASHLGAQIRIPAS